MNSQAEIPTRQLNHTYTTIKIMSRLRASLSKTRIQYIKMTWEITCNSKHTEITPTSSTSQLQAKFKHIIINYNTAKTSRTKRNCQSSKQKQWSAKLYIHNYNKIKSACIICASISKTRVQHENDTRNHSQLKTNRNNSNFFYRLTPSNVQKHNHQLKQREDFTNQTQSPIK